MLNEENIKQGLGGLCGVILSSLGIGLGDIEAIVSIVCSVVGLLITIVFAVIIPVVKKVIAAKKNDGKIDLDEAAEIVDTIEQGLKDVKSDIDKKNKK